MSRASAHARGAALLAKGEYGEASKVLRACVKDFGPHVGPLSDLVFATYLHQDMGAFQLAVEQLEAEFAKAQPRLSREAEALTRIVLAKAFELQGRIAGAFDEIEAVIGLLPKGTGNSTLIQAKCQKLRLLSSFGKESEIGPLYRDCLGISEESPQAMIECFHSLLLAEARLFGLAPTWPRFLHLSRSPGLHSADLRLCLIDLLEIAIEQNDSASQAKILEFIDENPVGTPDQYEAVVLKMARQRNRAFSVEDLFEWKRSIPYFGLIRLMALELGRGRADPGVEKQFIFLVQALDHRSRRLVSRKWPAFHASQETPLFTLDKNTLRFQGATISFAKSPQSLALLDILSERKEITPALLLELLGKADTLQNTESLRISVLRLNKKLMGLAGLPWVIKFGKEKILMNEKVQWERSRPASPKKQR